MKKFKTIALFLIILTVAMLSFVSCNNSKGQTPDYSIYKGAYYLKDGDKINQEVWIYVNADGTWQDNVANCGKFTVDDSKDDNIRFEGDLTLTGKIRARYLKIQNQGEVIEYQKGEGTPVPPAKYMCARHGHELKSFEAQNPTCTDEGCTAYNACVREGCDYSTRVAIAPLGHEFEEGKCVRCGENAPTQEEIARSEEIKEEIKNDVPDKKPQDIIVPIVPTKEDGATDEQIALAQQQADEAIEEKSYWTIVEIVKNWYAEKYAKSKEYPNSYVRKIHSIKESTSNFFLMIDAEIISMDVNGVYKKYYFPLIWKDSGRDPDNYKNAKDILGYLEGCNNISVPMTFYDYNTEFAFDIFNCVNNPNEENELIASKVIYESNGNLSDVFLMTYNKKDGKTDYTKYNFKTFTKHFSTDEIVAMAKTGELAYYGACTYYTGATDLDYDWESANNKYCKS